MIKKTTPHITQNEPLLFEISSPGKRGYQLPDLDVPAVDPKQALGTGAVRAEIEGFPEAFVPRAYLAKGNYFMLAGRSPFSRLVYPVPEPGGLGVHLTLDLAICGPSNLIRLA